MEISSGAYQLLRNAAIPSEFKEAVREVIPNVAMPHPPDFGSPATSPEIDMASIEMPTPRVSVPPVEISVPSVPMPWPEMSTSDRGVQAFYLTGFTLDLNAVAHMTPGLQNLARFPLAPIVLNLPAFWGTGQIFLLAQDGPPPNGGGDEDAGGAADPCGKKLWEITYTLRSPATDLIIRVKVERFEKCVKATFLNAKGEVLADSDQVTISEDMVQDIPGEKKVLVYDAPLNGKKIADRPDGKPYVVNGEIKLITTRGCAKVKYFQFAEQTIRTKNPLGRLGPKQTVNPFRPDGPQPNPGFDVPPDVPDGRPVFDIPSFSKDSLPFKPESVKDLLDGSSVIFMNRYLTYVCCDGVLLGSVGWGYDVVYEIKGGIVAGTTVKKVTAKWINKDVDTPGKDKVKCGE